MGHDSHTAIYDSARHRMVVFGGFETDGVVRNSTWVLALGDVPFWRQLRTMGTPPAGRFGHTAIYDPVHDRMVVFGGQDGDGLFFNDVWQLSFGDSTWSRLPVQGISPSARFRSTAVFDPLHVQMVAFGGQDSAGLFLNDTWTLSLGSTPTWARLLVPEPLPTERFDHTAVYDATRMRMVVFGGIGSPLLGDTWALSLGPDPGWTEIVTASPPPGARAGHAAIFDSSRDRMLVIGGSGSGLFDDVWTLSFSDSVWTVISPSGSAPVGRYRHSAVYDPIDDQVVMFGGDDSLMVPRNDAWELSLEPTPAWTELSSLTSLTGAWNGHTAIYDWVRARMVVFGGYDGLTDSWRNDVWALTLGDRPAWTEIEPRDGIRPPGRAEHSAIYDAAHDRMVVYGGWKRGTTNAYQDTWAFSFADSTWTELASSGGPPYGRVHHTAVWDQSHGRMVVYGGLDCNDHLNPGTWALSLGDGPTWTRMLCQNEPAGRAGHAACYDPVSDRMLVFGGADLPCETWALSFIDSTWTLLTPSGIAPPARFDHTAVLDPLCRRVLIFGGRDVSSSDTWALALGTWDWAELNPSGVRLAGRSAHSAIYDPLLNRMIVFGGGGGTTLSLSNDAWALGWGTSGIPETPPQRPEPASIVHVMPNPFHSSTTLWFELESPGPTRLEIFDTSGRRVRRVIDQVLSSGFHEATWDGWNDVGPLPAGVYYFRLQAPTGAASGKLVRQ